MGKNKSFKQQIYNIKKSFNRGKNLSIDDFEFNDDFEYQEKIIKTKNNKLTNKEENNY